VKPLFPSARDVIYGLPQKWKKCFMFFYLQINVFNFNIYLYAIAWQHACSVNSTFTVSQKVAQLESLILVLFMISSMRNIKLKVMSRVQNANVIECYGIERIVFVF